MKFIFNILILIPIVTYSQNELFREYNEKNGFCSFSLKLYSDSTYFYETGCEGRSNVNFGNWDQKADTIELIPRDTLLFNDDITIEETLINNNDSLFTITIVDRYDTPIPNFDLIIIPKGINHDWITNPGKFTLKKKGSPDLLLKSIQTNQNGKVIVDSIKLGTIKLLDLYQLFNNITTINFSENSSRNLIIKLNLHKEVFFYPYLKWIQLPNHKIESNKEELYFLNN